MFYTNLRCEGTCKTGVLLRAEKTPDGGMKGIYVSLTDGDFASYRVTIDAQGVETSRDRIGAPDVAAAEEAGPAGAARRQAVAPPRRRVRLRRPQVRRQRPQVPPAGAAAPAGQAPRGERRPRPSEAAVEAAVPRRGAGITAQARRMESRRHHDLGRHLAVGARNRRLARGGRREFANGCGPELRPHRALRRRHGRSPIQGCRVEGHQRRSRRERADLEPLHGAAAE